VSELRAMDNRGLLQNCGGAVMRSDGIDSCLGGSRAYLFLDPPAGLEVSSAASVG